jgi:hypothetical protein
MCDHHQRAVVLPVMVAVILAAQLLAAPLAARDSASRPTPPAGARPARTSTSPDTARPDTARPDTARSDTARSDTARSDTTPPDSVYATPALSALIEHVARENRVPPPSLQSYGARVESEIAVVMRKADGSEGTLSLEQSRNDVRWLRDGSYEQHMTAYRAQHVGPTISALAILTKAWTIPVLYGNRIALFFGLDSSRTAPRDGRTTATTTRGDSKPQGTLAVHPFAVDRDSVYRFSGGDTVAVLRIDGRTIPIARIHVEPRPDLRTPRLVVFRGEVDVDATRGAIVRMRGAFLTLAHGHREHLRVAGLPMDAVAFVELENVEVAGKYWFPRYQRIEAQVAIRAFGDSRTAFRIVSRFRDQHANIVFAQAGEVALDTPPALRTPDVTALVSDESPNAGGDTIAVRVHKLTFAPTDSLEHADDWWLALGDATADLHADDFLDLAPDVWRPTGAPLLELRGQRVGDFVHFNRIEGLTTGVAAELRLRDRMPGAVLRGQAGLAWAEHTVRGRLDAQWQRGSWIPGLRLERSLAITNEFGTSFDSGGTALGAIASVDDYDYVDRHAATLSLTRALDGPASGWLRLEAGMGSDRGAEARLRRGWFSADSTFRPNRGVAAGRYVRAAMELALNPDVSAEFVRPGVGALLRYEAAAGGLSWQRAEVRVSARQNAGAFTYAARLDAGTLFGAALPPQQLFELGRGQGLPGYGYKEFAGDRAALVRGLVMYRLPLWRSPMRIFGRPWLPPLGPAVALGVQSGAASASNDATRRAIALLGSTQDRIGAAPVPPGAGTPVSRPSDGFRTSIDAGLRFFGGALGIALARPIDHHARWDLVLSLGQGF